MIVTLAALLLLLFLVSVAGLSIGSVAVPLKNLLGALTGSADVPSSDRVILLDIRLPRVLLGIVVGAGLSIAGLVLQALLRNPLAEPYILGISSGGTVGALVAMSLTVGAQSGLFSAGTLSVPVASFAGSAAVMLLVYTLAHRHGQLDMYTLLLAGVMTGAFFNAAVLLIVAIANQEFRNAFLWLMGNLSSASTSSVALVTPLVLVASAFLFRHAKNYNLIALGDEAAVQLGLEVGPVRRLSYLLASLITGLVVSVSGVIGFVGLIIPHVCRLLFGPDHRLLLPASFLLGGTFLVAADLIARTVLAPTEIPVGAVTAAIGAPLFVYLLKKA